LEGTSVAAIVALAGFLASLGLYAFVPLARYGGSWQSPGSWVSVVVLGVGLVCFVVFFITGLITFFNRGTPPPSRQ
jgi:hypothetical protein